MADRVDFALTEKVADSDTSRPENAVSMATGVSAPLSAPPVQQAADLGAAVAGFGGFTPDFSAVFAGVPAGGGDFTEVESASDLPF